MDNGNKPSIRIDWFDGSLIEDARPTTAVPQFADEEDTAPQTIKKHAHNEMKPIGFKRLLDISLLKPPILTLEVAHRPGFWNLFNQDDLKGDFIVLIVKVLASVYTDLQPGEKSRIAHLLREKFISSNFLEQLQNYIASLPVVRVVEKRMNSFLWDDVEGFYFQTLRLVSGIKRFSGNNKEITDKLYDILTALDLSVIGVSEEHSERFSEELYETISILKSELSSEISDWECCDYNSDQKPQDPNNFKNLNIFPTRQDLLTNSIANIQPNIINGAYSSVEHYLDLQFKLLREDCFGPLREGICKYLADPTKRRYENIRVYPEVRILQTCISNNRIGHLVDIAWDQRLNSLDVSNNYIKQLMFGSLLLFTKDDFGTILCATVLDSSLELLKKGYLVVSFQNPVSKNIISDPYLMVESEVFFEPYHQVLKVLQSSQLNDIPMKKYIVDVKPENSPPAYLNKETIYITPSLDKSEEMPFPVLSNNQWPEDLGLDESQLEAYRFALTREFAVIQGPPGTGKTFIGVKIATTLLKNLSLDGTPMLVICYTNHALDQFLEGILNVTDSIVRLGSQSKSKKLEPYNLSNVRAKLKCKYSYLYASKKCELESIYKDMMNLQTEIEKSELGIVSYKFIKPYLIIDDKHYELKHSGEDNILNWLFEHLEPNSNKQLQNEQIDVRNAKQADSWENLDDEEIEQDKIETCFTEKWAINEIESINNVIQHVNTNTEVFNNPETIKKFEFQIEQIKKRLECFKKNMALLKNENRTYKLEPVKDLYCLNSNQRWQLYYHAVNEIKNKLLNKMDELLEKHNTANDELNEVSTLIDGEVIRTCRVVGVTTTAAARRHQLIKRLMSPIVIVEEAAEVLEAHIVASLTHHCQHLILIGDHKQLRPTAAHYRLARDYNLEISLFERMIRNGIHARTLTIQRRMRPAFVSLLVPGMYEKLDSHPRVLQYEDVRGMKENLYFLNHTEFEDANGLEDSWSHKNTFEAKWCVALANYLRQMKYKPDEVTILATYNGQVSLIKNLSRCYETLQDIKITAVDNYQGEESKIVILSLVRSNRDGKIGFLSAANRICVALSRAKEGFYLFGNMEVLKSESPIWRSINGRLIELNALGNKMTLICDAHRNLLDINNPEEFDTCLKGSCLRTCKEK